MARVRTVLADLPADQLGVTDAHDHLFFRSALLAGEELTDRGAARRELDALVAAGGQALVQWTPHGLGRDEVGLAELSRATGVHLVAATGLHQAAHYDDVPGGDLEELFVAEIEGDVRAGVIKVAGLYHDLDARSLDAAAAASRRTGAPVCVHVEAGTHADVILERVETSSTAWRRRGSSASCCSARTRRRAARVAARARTGSARARARGWSASWARPPRTRSSSRTPRGRSRCGRVSPPRSERLPRAGTSAPHARTPGPRRPPASGPSVRRREGGRRGSGPRSARPAREARSSRGALR